jgi:hypothetical protein
MNIVESTICYSNLKVKSTLLYANKFDKKDANYFTQTKNPPSVIEDMGTITFELVRMASNNCYESSWI